MPKSDPQLFLYAIIQIRHENVLVVTVQQIQAKLKSKAMRSQKKSLPKFIPL